MDEDDMIIEDDEALKEFLPNGFGKHTKETDVARQLEKSKRPTASTIKETKAEGKPSYDSSDHGSDDGSEDDDEYPVSHELVLKTHERPITTLTVDPSGSRFITGSTDSTPQAKIFSRDGEELKEFVKGDMYLRDMHNTKGHISAITTGTWHPTNRDLCVTAGTDSTLRIWDVNMPLKQKEVIVHKSRAAGSAGRTRMTAVVWGTPIQGGKNLLVAAAMDGSLVMWDGDGPYSRPAAEIRDAHKKDTWTGGVDISADGRTVVTRGGDDTIKLWDTRKFKQPISVVEHPSTSDQYANSDIKFSPNSSSIITGSATGHLHVLNPATLKPELVTPVTDGSSLVTLLWHERLNQILTGSANAEMHVLYNPNTSNNRGAAMVMSKAPKRRHIDDDPNLTTDLSQGLSGEAISNGEGLRAAQAGTSYASRHPTIGLTVSGKSRDPRRPHIPMTTPFAKSQPDEKHVRENIPLSSMRDEDPREALLKYAEKAEKDPMFTNAWKKTQPKTLYADISDGEENDGPDKKKARKS
ncbi:WD repeat-containing protein 70, partial [Lecanoromycetidae sp. Uapishka_2]